MHYDLIDVIYIFPSENAWLRFTSRFMHIYDKTVNVLLCSDLKIWMSKNINN